MRTALRTSGFVIGVLVAGGVAACHRDTSPSDELAKDLKNASSSQGALTLAPGSQGVSTVSAIERTRASASAPANSQRVVVHHKSTRRREVAPVTRVQEAAQTAVVEAPVAAPQSSAAPSPEPSVPTPHPHDVAGTTPAPNSDGSGQQPGDGGGPSIGSVLGAIIRGGVVTGDDHCDPRSEGRGRHGGGIIISGMPGGVIRYESPVQSGQPGRTALLRGASY